MTLEVQVEEFLNVQNEDDHFQTSNCQIRQLFDTIRYHLSIHDSVIRATDSRELRSNRIMIFLILGNILF